MLKPLISDEIMQPDDVLMFWFSDSIRSLWFESDLIFDQEVSKMFSGLCQDASDGKLADWEASADSILPLILALDQFPRNIHRGTAQAFESDGEALRVAKEAVAKGYDRNMSKQERMFAYMPFMHSESLEDQKQSVALYADLGLPESLDYAKRHLEVIEQFGRFPSRNKALGRETTPEEATFLKEKPLGF